MCRVRAGLVALTVIAMLSTLAAPAAAITYGEPDAGEHPNVGALLLVRERVDPDTGDTVTSIRPDCSGTLIGERVFLTAGHCVAWLEQLQHPPGLAVTFAEDPPFEDPELMRPQMIAVEDWTHAGFAGFETEDGDARDLALLRLASAPPLEPASLVRPGALDQLHRHDQKGLVFTSVGYGAGERQHDGGEPRFRRQTARMRAEGVLLSVTRNWLTLSQNPARGHGGTCIGDSGGPIFTTVDGRYVIVAVTSTGDAVCRATNKAYRVDSPVGQEFLADHLAR